MIVFLRAFMIAIGAGIGIAAARFAADKLVGPAPDPEGFEAAAAWEARYRRWQEQQAKLTPGLCCPDVNADGRCVLEAGHSPPHARSVKKGEKSTGGS